MAQSTVDFRKRVTCKSTVTFRIAHVLPTIVTYEIAGKAILSRCQTRVNGDHLPLYAQSIARQFKQVFGDGIVQMVHNPKRQHNVKTGELIQLRPIQLAAFEMSTYSESTLRSVNVFLANVVAPVFYCPRQMGQDFSSAASDIQYPAARRRSNEVCYEVTANLLGPHNVLHDVIDEGLRKNSPDPARNLAHGLPPRNDDNA